MAMGLAQAVALIPGTSRSGITMAAGMLGGKPSRRAKFSFIMVIPLLGRPLSGAWICSRASEHT